YAVSIHWSDGHASGIYRFEFLRQICPCEQCGVKPD
ncbi:MAG: gamma-butyrobetaine hydroxylase-like domain-containing protein, partial [Acidimicrobiia bacterium]